MKKENNHGLVINPELSFLPYYNIENDFRSIYSLLQSGNVQYFER